MSHDRPGGLFGAPADPELSARGQAIADNFQQQYSAQAPERGAYCVNSGMPESMFGIAGYPLDIIQRDDRITIISEFQTEVRRIYLDGRSIPGNQPLTRNGYSVGEWGSEDGRDVLQVTTGRIKAWEVDKWRHSDEVQVVEILSLKPLSAVDLPGNPPQDLAADAMLLENKITVSDPVMYSEPQTVTIWMYKVEDSALLEYTCAEYNWRNALEEFSKD